jgi:hypothetical protein
MDNTRFRTGTDHTDGSTERTRISRKARKGAKSRRRILRVQPGSVNKLLQNLKKSYPCGTPDHRAGVLPLRLCAFARGFGLFSGEPRIPVLESRGICGEPLFYDAVGQVCHLVACANVNLFEADVPAAEMVEETDPFA